MRGGRPRSNWALRSPSNENVPDSHRVLLRTLPDSLAHSANRSPRRAVLFYATDDDQAASAIERRITICGFEPIRAGGVNDAGRIEVPGGDLHQNGGLGGRLLGLDQARAAIAAA
jgi:8-hydroxy-5-deazaflavin:NADPH oxidoreductase